MDQMTSMNSNQLIKTHEDILEALLFTQETLDRCMVPFVVLDDTARAIMINEPMLALPEISIGIKKNDWTKSGGEMVKMFIPSLEDNKINMMFTHRGIPVIMWFIENEYQFLKNPDVCFYQISQFHVPNPFKDYWKARDLIK